MRNTPDARWLCTALPYASTTFKPYPLLENTNTREYTEILQEVVGNAALPVPVKGA